MGHHFKIIVINSGLGGSKKPERFCALFESDEPVEYVFDSLHTDGMFMDLIKVHGEVPLIHHLSQITPFETTTEQLKERYRLISEYESIDIPGASQSEFLISIPELDGFYNSDDQLEFEDFIRTEFGETVTGLTKKVNIAEFGASGHMVEFLINLGAGFTQVGIQKIHDFFKKKGLSPQNVSIQQVNTGNAKEKLAEIFEINPENLKVESCTNKDDRTEFVFFSRSTKYYLTLDSKGQLLESKQQQFNQTSI